MKRARLVTSRLVAAPLLTAVLTLLAAHLFTAVASAAPAGDPAAARALFMQGRDLAAAGRYAEACPKFEASLQIDPGVGTKFNLADCWEQTGRVASAWALFLEVAADSKAAQQADREAVARERAATLEAKLPSLKLIVTAPPAGLEVRSDGKLVTAAAWGTALPMDPGPHQLEARAPGMKPWSGSVNVPNAAGTTSFEIPALQPAREAAPVTASANSGENSQGDEPRAGASNTPLLIAGIGTGVLAAGSVVTGVLYSSRQTAYNEVNVEGNPERRSKHDAAETMGVVNLVLVGATLIGAGVTVYLWVSSPEGATEMARNDATTLSIVTQPNFSGVVFEGKLP